MKKYMIIILSVLFVFISCQTSKDRTDRIHELYSGYCKEGNFICEANVLFKCIDNTWELLQHCESRTCNYVTGKCEGEIDDADSTDIDITDIENDADEESDNEISDTDTDTDTEEKLCYGDFPFENKGVCWSEKSVNQMEWKNADEYCKEIGGKLPTINELRMLIRNCPQTEYPKPSNLDDQKWCAVEDPDNLYFESSPENCSLECSGILSFFGDTDNLWSSSLNGDSYVWLVTFNDGRVDFTYKFNDQKFRCVR